MLDISSAGLYQEFKYIKKILRKKMMLKVLLVKYPKKFTDIRRYMYERNFSMKLMN